MSAVGFDIGNDTSVIAAAKHRGVDVLLNDESKRETPSFVSFSDKQRLLGCAAASSFSMSPKSTISQLKRLLGRPFSHPSVRADLKSLPFSVSESIDGGIVIHLRYLGSDCTFTPVQVLGMLLAHLKHLAEKDLESPVSDCVLGVPSYFTDLQRRIYLDAAAIAGLKPLRLMHDCAATALGYGIYKTDLAPLGSPSFNAVFVDIGHCDTQVAVVAFAVGQMRVLSHAFDADLGGRDFDEVLFDYFVGQFKDKYDIDVNSNVRASIRLRLACEKLKKVLSANAEAPMSIECLMDEKDVKGFIKREEFERLCAGLLERVLEPCKKAIMDSGLSVDRIHSVELVGSGSRIPAIMRILTGFFRREPGRTLNASECVARGCALQCAMLSPVFRVRDYEVQDSLPSSIGFASEEGPIHTMSSNVLFRKGQTIPSVKVLTLHRSHSFNLEAFYTNQNELPPGVLPKIGSFQIGPFQVAQSEKPKVKVRIRLNLHGLVSVESASLIEDDVNESIMRDGNCKDNMESLSASSTQYNVAADNAENGSTASCESGSMPSAERIKRERESRRLDLPVKETIYGGMTKEELREGQEQERQLAYQDKLMELTKDRKNALEAYVYDIRNKLFERYRSFASDSEREGISANLQQTEEWLYEDGDDETEKVYTSKLEDLKKLVDPIENRYKDEEARAQTTRELLKCIVDNRMAVKSLATYERDAVINECTKAEQWLREKSQQQDSLPKSADPVLWSHEIKKRAEDLDITCRNILRHKGSPARTDDTRSSDQSNAPDNMETD
ncbi:heat shock 70 kDa protein 16 [Typha latifolia]|uniref:heat shock 70 kDa protein 16 n=1 Tax=Typha latifolia TaxID=4733 RepID=UPI003C2EAD28